MSIRKCLPIVFSGKKRRPIIWRIRKECLPLQQMKRRMRQCGLRLAVLAGLLGCAVSGMAGDDEFTVASLNVDGLPSTIWIIPSNPDGPGDDGTRAVSQYLAAKGYDIIGTQEDFNYDEELRSALESDYDYGLWKGDIDMGKVDWLRFWDTKFDTDGLRLFWRKEHRQEQEEATTWHDSYGRFDHCWDDMVTKGFLRNEMSLASGRRIVVYNMHMDASTEADEAVGNDQGDMAARRSQWIQLREELMSRLDDRPVILLGDMNSLYPRDSILSLFIDPINATGLYEAKDAWVESHLGGVFPALGGDRHVAYANGEALDKILYINPLHGSRIELKWYRQERDYTWDDGTPMGDHYPVAAAFTFVDGQPDGMSPLEHWLVADAYYAVDGRSLSQPHRGLNIVRMSDGSVRKIIIR